MKLVFYENQEIRDAERRQYSYNASIVGMNKAFYEAIFNLQVPTKSGNYVSDKDKFPNMVILDIDTTCEEYNNFEVFTSQLSDKINCYKAKDEFTGTYGTISRYAKESLERNDIITPYFTLNTDYEGDYSPRKLMYLRLNLRKILYELFLMHIDSKIHINNVYYTEKNCRIIHKYSVTSVENNKYVPFREDSFTQNLVPIMEIQCDYECNLFKGKVVPRKYMIDEYNIGSGAILRDFPLINTENNLFYCIEDENCRLIPFKRYYIKNEYNRDCLINLFYGIRKVRKDDKSDECVLTKGIFYFYKNNPVCLYGISSVAGAKDCDEKTIHFSDIDKVFSKIPYAVSQYDIRDRKEINHYLSNANGALKSEVNFDEFDTKLKSLNNFNFDDELYINDAQALEDYLNANFILELSIPDKIVYKDTISWIKTKQFLGMMQYYEYKCNDNFSILTQLKTKQPTSYINVFTPEIMWKRCQVLKYVKDACTIEVHFSYESDTAKIYLSFEKNGESGKKVNFKISLDTLMTLWPKDFKEEDVVAFMFFDITSFSDATINDISKILERYIGILEEYTNDVNGKYQTLLRNCLSQMDSQIKSSNSLLYKPGEVVDELVTEQVCAVSNIYNLEKKRINEDPYDEKVPLLAILGDAGSGKTTMAGRIAKIFGKGLYPISSSDLKAPYVGQTGYRVADIILKAQENNQIILIDEAYNLQEDQYGREALDLLLPIMSGNRRSMYVRIVAPGSAEVIEERILTTKPIIWFAGYPTPLRKMISKNEGLYRRVKEIELHTPSVEDLYKYFLNIIEEESKKYSAIDLDIAFKKRNVIKSCEKEIKNYFEWGTNKEINPYFANYSGVRRFYDTLTAYMDNNMYDDKIRNLINELIEKSKTEIKKQYKAVLSSDNDIKFEVQRDVQETFNNVKGYPKEIESLRQIISMLVDGNEYYEKGLMLPKGLLLAGKPGVGKTMIARAFAGELKKACEEKEKKDIRTAFIPVAASELDRSDKIISLFAEADNYDSVVYFIDEIDAIGKHRDKNPIHSQELIQLMKELDGFNNKKNIFVIAATNEPEVLDPALKRAGRFDRCIELGNIDKEGRREVLELYLKKLEIINKAMKDDTNYKIYNDMLDKLVVETFSFAPSDIKALVNNAALLYEQCENADESTWKDKYEYRVKAGITKASSNLDKFKADILECIERNIVGEVRKSKKEDTFDISKNAGCSATAIHEVGHALIAVKYGIKPFEKVTVIPRGDALGYVRPNLEEEINTKEDFNRKLEMYLGGRAAEKVIFGIDKVSAGAVSDLQMATNLAEDMVAVYGMSETLGAVTLKVYDDGYLGSSSHFICSDAKRAIVEDETMKLLKTAELRAIDYLSANKDKLKKMAELLFSKETMSGEEFINLSK